MDQCECRANDPRSSQFCHDGTMIAPYRTASSVAVVPIAIFREPITWLRWVSLISFGAAAPIVASAVHTVHDSWRIMISDAEFIIRSYTIVQLIFR